MPVSHAIRHLARTRFIMKKAGGMTATLICIFATQVTQGAHELNTGSTSTLIEHADDRGQPFILMTARYVDDPKLSLVTTPIEPLSDPLISDRYHQLDKAFWGIQAHVDISDTIGHVTTEMGYGGISAIDGEGFGDANHHFMRIQTSKQTARLRYGMNFQSAGAQFYRPGSDIPADRAIAEAWAAKIWRRLRVRSYVSQSYDNLAHDPTRARLIDTQLGSKLEYTMASWPNLSYAIEQAVGVRHSTLDPIAALPIQGAIDSTRISINYRSTHWSSTLSSSYSTQHNNDGALSERKTKQQVKGSVHLSERFSFHPGVAYTTMNSTVATEQAWVNMRYQSLWQPAQVSSYLSQTNTHENNTISSEHRHGAEISARWRSSIFATSGNLSLRIAYDRYQSYSAYPQGISFWFGWQSLVSGFSPLAELSSLRNFRN